MDKKQVQSTKSWVFWVTVFLVASLLIGGIMGTSRLLEEKSVPFNISAVPLGNGIIWSLLVLVAYRVINLMIDHFAFMEREITKIDNKQ
jgi:hypothetical protein